MVIIEVVINQFPFPVWKLKIEEWIIENYCPLALADRY